MGYYNPSNLTDSGFHSTFDMVMKNGSAPHMHQISNGTISDVKMDGNNTVIQGKVTITMKDGPVVDVPTTWTISNNNTLAIKLDPSMINNHFGESPIYGLVLTPEKEMNIMNKMMEDSKFMDQWIPLMMQNMMSTLNMNGKNMSAMPQMMDSSASNSSMGMNMSNNMVIQ
jgi:ribosomal protein S4E